MKIIITLLVSLSLNPQVDTLHLDKRTYIGQMPTGEGKLYDNERGLFIGNFNRTLPSGRGIHFRPDGGKYVGHFVKGQYQGYGRYFMHTGAVICGEFRSGRANGLDTLFYPDGKVFIGVMQNNGATSQGKTYKNAQAAKVSKPVFPEIYLREEDQAFVDDLTNDAYDTPAIFKDGTSFFQAHIHPNFRYTESMAKRSAVVHYEFVVGADGKISDVTILSTTDEAFSKELVRVIKRSPRWKPAMKDGQAVPYTIKKQRAVFNMAE